MSRKAGRASRKGGLKNGRRATRRVVEEVD